MAKRKPQHIPKILYQLTLSSNVPGMGWRRIFVYCTPRSDAEIVQLYRKQNPTDGSRFISCYELGGSELIIA